MAKAYLKLPRILKRLLFERDMKPVDLARALGIPAPTIHRLVTGKSTRPYRSSLQPIADYFAIDLAQLTGEEPLSEEEKTPFPSVVRIKSILLCEWEAVLPPSPPTANQKQIAVAGNLSEDSFALVMNDSSMEPLFPKGTILIFDPHQTPKDRSYVLVKLQGTEIPVFRQLLVDADHRYLKPLNPDLNIDRMRLFKTQDSIIGCLFESRIHHQPDESNGTMEVTS